jgi:hypothetical protein
VTSTVVDSPCPSVGVAGVATLNAADPGPVTANGGVSVAVFVASFVIVTLAITDAPTATDPKSINAGDTLMPGVIGLLRFCGSEVVCRKKSFALLSVSI